VQRKRDDAGINAVERPICAFAIECWLRCSSRQSGTVNSAGFDSPTRYLAVRLQLKFCLGREIIRDWLSQQLIKPIKECLELRVTAQSVEIGVTMHPAFRLGVCARAPALEHLESKLQLPH
jgi:hypothetical protein